MIISVSATQSFVCVQIAMTTTNVIRTLACLGFIFFRPGQGYNLNWKDVIYMGWKNSNADSSDVPMWSEQCRPSPNPSRYKYPDMSKEYRKCAKQLSKTKSKGHPLIGKDTEIIEFYGYPSEIHKITTKDGYILTLHRIPSNGTSVLLWHGLGGCSDNWVFNGPTQSLAFILADQGFDVWLGNSRGSSYSLGHQTLSSDDTDYWDFSWHENGLFDLPASIKHIRMRNGHTSIFYVGHSQGTTNFMVGASTKPATKLVNRDNILAAFLLAPAGFIGRYSEGTRVTIPALANPISGKLVWRALGGRLESPKDREEFYRIHLGYGCSSNELLCGACPSPVLAMYGVDPSLMNYTNVPHLMDKYPNTLNIKSFLHYAQSVQSCKFRQFDYGLRENRHRYGSHSPPDYELKNINVPTYIYWGESDTTCNPKDVKRTKDAFKKKVVKAFVRVDFDSFQHLDFVVAKRVKELVYDQIVSEMQKLQVQQD